MYLNYHTTVNVMYVGDCYWCHDYMVLLQSTLDLDSDINIIFNVLCFVIIVEPSKRTNLSTDNLVNSYILSYYVLK